jgi:hypothetical protein
LTLSGVLVIGNHPKNFPKKKKSEKKNSKYFSKIKVLLCNSYARITKKLKILKNSNFFPTKIDKPADLYITTQSYPEGTIFF